MQGYSFDVLSRLGSNLVYLLADELYAVYWWREATRHRSRPRCIARLSSSLRSVAAATREIDNLARNVGPFRSRSKANVIVPLLHDSISDPAVK